MQLFFRELHQYSNILRIFVCLFVFSFFRNVLSTSCTTIPLLESPTRETLWSIQIANATDGILSLTAMNAVVLYRSTQSFTITGLEGVQPFTVIISSKAIVRTLHGVQSALNSG